MGKATQYRNWAVTWNSGFHQLEPTTRNGHRLSTGGYDFVLYIGPKESPDAECSSDHQHVMVHCETANVSKTKVREALVAYSSLDSEVVQESISYISKVYSTKSKYIVYCFKGLNESTSHADDDIVKDTIDNIKQSGVIPTHNSVKRKLIDDHGANAYNKRFCKIAETYIAETDVIDNRGNPKIEIDSNENMLNFICQLLYYYMIIKQTSVTTLCKDFKNMTQPLLKDCVYLLSLLPYFTKRVVGINDNLPSLLFYGIQNAGKSSMFNNCRYVKKIATDSLGVSRYRMDKMHTTILLDDITNCILDSKENASTLKQLTLGNDVEIKVHGSTQNIKAFVIITSNEKPLFTMPVEYVDINNQTTEEINTYINRQSWLRRFLVCEFTKQCPFDMNSVNFDDLKLRDVAAQMFRNKYTKMLSDYELESQIIESKFSLYYNVALEDYSSERIDNTFDDLMDQACDIVNNTMADYTMYTLMNAEQPVSKLELGPVKDIVRPNIKNANPDPFIEERLLSEAENSDNEN
jgi:hypothetical protein